MAKCLIESSVILITVLAIVQPLGKIHNQISLGSQMNLNKIQNDILDCGENIFLDNAGASLMPNPVVQKITEYLTLEQLKGGYKTAEENKNLFDDFYIEVAKLINAKPNNIAFTQSATDSYIKALSSVDFKKDDVIITTADDYGSNQIQFFSLKQRYGIQIKRINLLENGDLDIDHFKELVKQYSPKLVAITHIPTNSGLVQDIKSIGEICSKHKIIYLLDACQSIGQLNVDVHKIKCDFLTATGRKFLRGPRGTGFLYVSDKMLEQKKHPLFIDANGAKWLDGDNYEITNSAKRFETWEKPYALKLGLIEAIKYLNNIGIDTVHNYNTKLITQFRANLKAIPNVNMFDRGSQTCNILTFNKDFKSLKPISQKLEENNIIFSVIEKDWQPIDFDKKGVDWVIRLSPHYINTKEQIDRVSEIIEKI